MIDVEQREMVAIDMRESQFRIVGRLSCLSRSHKTLGYCNGTGAAGPARGSRPLASYTAISGVQGLRPTIVRVLGSGAE